jgi:hypothetical protein
VSTKHNPHQIAANRIEITIEGDNGAKSDVTLAAFYKLLEGVHSLLKKIETKKTGENKAHTTFLVADLSHSSPARVVIEAYANTKNFDPVTVVQGFDDALYSAYTGESLGESDEEILKDLRNIVRLAKKNTLVFGTKKNYYELTEAVMKRIDVELATTEVEYGTAEGTLDQINIHEGRNYFYIYFSAGSGRLKCLFPPNLIDSATSAIGKKVSVTGQLHYRVKSPHPIEIRVKDIEVFAMDNELPDFDDIRGLAPDITGGKSSEAYIAEMRDAWD